MILASKWVRTKETAEFVAKVLRRDDIELAENIHEKKYASALYGISRTSELHQAFKAAVISNWENLDWKFMEDGESLRDTISRAADFRNVILEKYADKDIVIISHGIFLKCLIAVCIFKTGFTDKIFIDFFQAIHFPNCGLCELEYDNETLSWKITF